jgi:RNA-binding protein YhbY
MQGRITLAPFKTEKLSNKEYLKVFNALGLEEKIKENGLTRKLLQECRDEIKRRYNVKVSFWTIGKKVKELLSFKSSREKFKDPVFIDLVVFLYKKHKSSFTVSRILSERLPEYKASPETIAKIVRSRNLLLVTRKNT